MKCVGPIPRSGRTNPASQIFAFAFVCAESATSTSNSAAAIYVLSLSPAEDGKGEGRRDNGGRSLYVSSLVFVSAVFLRSADLR